MKKIFFTTLLSLISIPAFAVCSITGGACSSDFGLPSLNEKLVPDNLQNLEETNTFQRDNIQPYSTETTDNLNKEQASSTPKSRDYNADCQFGVCLPSGY